MQNNLSKKRTKREQMMNTGTGFHTSFEIKDPKNAKYNEQKHH